MANKLLQRDGPAGLCDYLNVLNDLPRNDEERRSFELGLYDLQVKYEIEMNEWGPQGRDNEGERDPDELEDEQFQSQTVDDIYAAFDESARRLNREHLTKYLGYRPPFGEMFEMSRLYDDEKRLRSIISAFAKWKSLYPRYSHSEFELAAPLTKFGFTLEGTLQAPQSKIISIMYQQNVPVDCLMICPICDKFKWIVRRGTTKTCGNQKCADAFKNNKKGR